MAELAAAMTVNVLVENGALGQQIRGIKMLTGSKIASGAVLQRDAHAAAQNENPLCGGGAVE